MARENRIFANSEFFSKCPKIKDPKENRIPDTEGC